jgi:hypothetical protein
MGRLLMSFSLVALGAGCQHAPTSETFTKTDFQPIGRIDFRGFGAAFADDQVVGPNVNVSRRADGSWTGRIRDSIVDVNVYSAAVRGSGLTASWDEAPGGVIIHSVCYGQILRIEVNEELLKLRTSANAHPMGRPVMVPGMGPIYNEGALPGSGPPDFRPTNSFTLLRLDREHFQGDFRLSGAAAVLHPPEPQFALAMIGAFD